MRKRDIIIASLCFFLCTILTAEVVTYQLTGGHLFAIGSGSGNEPHVKRGKCTDKPIPKRQQTDDPQLKALAEYEHACQSAFASDLMIFTDMPASNSEAMIQADAMAARLMDFAAWKITPIVIVEPTSSHGLISFHDYADGIYDKWNKAYFARLKENGITASQIGIWIPFPEPQQPTWRDNTPDDFAKSVNRFFKIEKSYFPAAKTAILLDSQVNSATVSQLLAWTRLIDNSLVDIAGLQGFPWYPSSDDDPRQPVTSASVFAPASLLEQIARSLDTHQVLINTGTFRHKLKDDGSELAVPNSDREATISSIVHQVGILRQDHYKVTVNIFAQNKLHTEEGVDWSYWQRGDYDLSKSTGLFTNFVRKLKDKNATISIFDAR